MRDRSASPVRTLTIFVVVCAAIFASGCSTERADGKNADGQSAGVTATGNTGRISGKIDSLVASGAARQAAQATWSVKVFLYVELMARAGDSLCDSVSAIPGGTYEFKELPDGSFKVYAVSDANGWRSDTLRAEIKGGADVPLAVPVKAPATGTGVRKGMTWLKRLREDRFGIDYLHCKGAINGTVSECDPIAGDQPCTAVLPILCSKAEGLSRPAYNVNYPSKSNDPYYGPWFEGRAALGNRVEGRSLRSKAIGDSVCAASLGTGWQMAGFHDGRYVAGMDSVSYTGAGWDAATKSSGAWGFYAATANIPMDIRFWAYIDDQLGNCWDP